MQIVVKERTPGNWVIELVSTMGVAAGRTVYPSQAAALEEGRRQHPDKEIVVQS